MQNIANSRTISTACQSDKISDLDLYLMPADYEINNTVIENIYTGVQIQDCRLFDLNLSARSYNALRRYGIYTLLQLATKSRAEIHRIRGIGPDSAEEIITSFREYINRFSANDESNYSEEKKSLLEEIRAGIPPQIARVSLHTSLRDTWLSIRAQNSLIQNNISTVEQLLNTKKEDIANIRNIGSQTCNEIVNFKKSYAERFRIKYLAKGDERRQQIVALLDSFMEDLIEIGIHDDVLPVFLIQEAEVAENVVDINKEIREIWWKNDRVVEGLRKKILTYLFERPMGGATLAMIRTYLPLSIPFHVLEEQMLHLNAEGMVTLDCVFGTETYFHRMFRVTDLSKEYINDRQAEIITRRINGETIDEIAINLGVTKERVRQIQEKGIRNLHIICGQKNIFIKERRFMALFEKYDIKSDEYIALTGDDLSSYRFMLLCSKKGTTSSDEIVDDETVPSWIKENLVKYIQSRNTKYGTKLGLLSDNGKCSIQNKRGIEQAVLATKCQNVVTFEEFARFYNEYLISHGLGAHKNLFVTYKNIHSRESFMANSRYLLWNRGRRLRYYDIDSRDYKELLQTLNLRQYKERFLSAAFLFNRYPDLMQKYDIRDEYELHDLLKKIIQDEDESIIAFDRTPTIRFGVSSRDEYVRKMLKQLKPTTKEDFVLALSEDSGYSPRQTHGWLQCTRYYWNRAEQKD